MNSSELLVLIDDFRSKMKNYHTSMQVMISPEFDNTDRATILVKRAIDMSEFATTMVSQAICPLIVMGNGDITSAKEMVNIIASSALKDAETHAKVIIGPSKK